MFTYVKEGFQAVRQQPVLLLFLFLYQWIWGMILYKFINTMISPLLYRFPGEELTPADTQLFLAESQFHLMKTDISQSYLWIFLIIVALRMLITPLMKAGIYYSLHHTELNAGYRFIHGIRKLGKRYILYYIIQTLLTFAPLIWVIPHCSPLLSNATSYSDAGLDVLPYVLAMLVYGYLIHLAMLYVQLGKLTETHWLIMLFIYFKNLLPATGVALIIVLISLLVNVLVLSASMYWAGIAAIILYQVYHLPKIAFEVWGIASQYRLWTNKA